MKYHQSIIIVPFMLVLVWSTNKFYAKGFSLNVCFNSSQQNNSIKIPLSTPQTIRNVNFSNPINFRLLKLQYSYNNSTWNTVQVNESLVKNKLGINLYALNVIVILQSTNLSFNGCQNASVDVTLEELSPSITFNSSDNELVHCKEVFISVEGQHVDSPVCYIFNKTQHLPVVTKSVAQKGNTIQSEFILSLNKTNNYETFCKICNKTSCEITLTCEASYPGGVNVTLEKYNFVTTIQLSSLNIMSVIPNVMSAVISGKVATDKCKIDKAKFITQNETQEHSITGEFNFTLNNLTLCVKNNVSVFTYSSTGLRNVQTISILTQPNFGNVSAVLVMEKDVNVSWGYVSCVDKYSHVEIEYGTDQFGFTKKTVPISDEWNLLSNLNSSSIYKIRLRFKNQSIISEWSQIMKIQTPVIPKLQKPGPLLTKSLKSVLNLTWSYSGSVNDNITFQVDIVSYRPYDQSYIMQKKQYNLTVPSLLDRNFSITYATVYNITIVAFISMIYSESLQEQIITAANVQNVGPIPLKPVVTKILPTTIELTLQPVASPNAPVSFYDIIVSSDVSFSPTPLSVFVDYDAAKRLNLLHYIAVRTTDTQNIVIGDKDIGKNNFTNMPLVPQQKYQIFVRFGSIWNGETQFSPLFGNQSVLITTSKQKKSSSLSAGAKAAIIVSAIALVFILFFLWVCYQIRKGRRHDQAHSSVDYNSTLPRKTSEITTGRVNLEFEMDSGVLSGYCPLKYEVNETYQPVTVAEFPNYVTQIKENHDIRAQFKQLNNSQDVNCQCGRNPVNASRNRYEDIVPFDYNRFILEADKKASDYINASLVSNYMVKDAFIATQGPLPSTFIDFWKMVWQSEAKTIVVLGQRIENGIIKYALYWPTTVNVEMKYGKILAKMVSYEKFGGYAITTLFVYMKKQPKLLTVKLFHFSAWPDRQAPTKIEEFLSFRKAVANWRKEGTGAVIVHCSAGVGRTGSFIAIDSIIENMTRTQTIDVFNFVNYLRTRRLYMVQTPEQYEFIFDTLVEHLIGQKSADQINGKNIDNIVKELSKVDSVTELDGFTKFYQAINRQSAVYHRTKYNEGSKEEHILKNRYPDKVPDDAYRVKVLVAGLTLNETYINATQVNSRLIATQAPLETTCKDFWLMVYDSSILNIVMLNNRQEGVEIFADYFSSAETTSYGPLTVTVVSESTPHEFVVKREMVLVHEDAPKDERTLTHYHVSNWPIHSIPDSPSSVVYILNEMQRANSTEPTVVHCSDGYGRTGCLMACDICVELLDENDHVTVDSVVKMLREKNAWFVDAVEQYEFIYRFLQEYLKARYSGVTYI